MSVDAILWDNDGVLVDTEPLYLRANQEILAEVGVALDEAAYQDLSLRQGRSVFVLAQERGVGEARIRALRERRDLRYAELLDEGVAVLDGVRDSLSALEGRVPMAIVTSSTRSHFDRIHAQTGLLRHFEFALASGEYARHKPHPDPYLEAAARLGIAPHRCLAVEDTERGLQAAVAAGMRCVVIPRPLSRSFDFVGAHRLLGEATQVVAVVDALIGDERREEGAVR